MCSHVWWFLTSELVYWTEARMREEVTEEGEKKKKLNLEKCLKSQMHK